MLTRNTLLALLALVACLALPGKCLAADTPTERRAEQLAERNTTAYTLPPETLRQAIALTRVRMIFELGGTAWTFVQLLLILSLGIAARMGRFATDLTKFRFVQGFAFLFLLLALTGLLDLPLEIYGHHIALSYGLSIQSWPSWLGDLAKSFALEWLVGGLLLIILFWVIRRSPNRWWFWFWIPTVALSILGVFLTPYIIDPLFNKFEPLANSDPALVVRLEQVVARSGIAIPPDRMFLMKASAKSTELNAYVTGFGTSKRVVVWDTTIAKSTPDEIALIFGHELGHYALGHIASTVLFVSAMLLPLFWLGFHGVRFLLARFGSAWGISSQNDWAAAVVFALVLFTLSFLSDPIFNAFSRAHEHAADVFGQEAVHSIVADPQSVGRQSFQVLGETSLDDPTPHPFFEFWFGTHPPIRTRAAFAQFYNPWAPGEHPKYFTK
jgi:Zn-dependent protease with chaperone function